MTQTLDTAEVRKDDQTPTAVTVISFGYGHGAAPEAHAVYDVRHHFKDPHVSPALRDMTGIDRPVIDAVLGTPGIVELIDAIAYTAEAFLAGPRQGHLVIAVGCVGGRHRSVVVADQVARRLRDLGVSVTLHDRDRHRPVIARPATPAQGSDPQMKHRTGRDGHGQQVNVGNRVYVNGQLVSEDGGKTINAREIGSISFDAGTRTSRVSFPGGDELTIQLEDGE